MAAVLLLLVVGHAPTPSRLDDTAVTRGQLQDAFARSLRAVDAELAAVDTACTMRIERAHAAPRLCLSTSGVRSRCFRPARGKNATNATDVDDLWREMGSRARVCTLRGSAGGHGGAAALGTTARMPVVTFADSLPFLATMWGAFLNKASFCERTNRTLVLWLGSLSRTTLDRRNELADELPWCFRCEEATARNTVHLYKALALLLALRLEPRARAAFYMDADTWFSSGAEGEGAATPEAYLRLAPRAHLVGAPNAYFQSRILMNAGLLIVRNTEWARGFLAAWWMLRCGTHDQGSFWGLLFMCLSAESAGAFRFERARFSRYSEAKAYALPHLLAHLHTLRVGASRWDGAAALANSTLVTTPLELPRVLVLPVAPIDPRGGGLRAAGAQPGARDTALLPAFRSDVDPLRHTFVCHTKPDKSEASQCVGKRACAGCRCQGANCHRSEPAQKAPASLTRDPGESRMTMSWARLTAAWHRMGLPQLSIKTPDAA